MTKHTVKSLLELADTYAYKYLTDFVCMGKYRDALREALSEALSQPFSVIELVLSNEQYRHQKQEERLAPQAAQPVREPLTDAQIDNAYCVSQHQYLSTKDRQRVIAFARAIECAHGIGVSK